MELDDENQPVTVLKGVGPQLSAKLDRLGIVTLQDLIFHLPLRYQDRTRVTAIGTLTGGREALVLARIELAEVVYRKRRSLLVRISDDTGSLTLRMFHFSNAQSAALRRGAWVWCFGEVRHGPVTLEMVHPEYRVFDDKPSAPLADTLTPVYPTTEGVGQTTLRKITDQVLFEKATAVRDWMPGEIRRKYKFASLQGQ
ncbi:OB-fold nucleic acid binding domain-containing protein [Pseudomonadota bacterium]